MDQHTDLWSRLISILSYTVPSGVVFSDIMGWLNNNAGSVASITAILTLLVNWAYQHRKDRRDRNRRIEQLKKAYQWPKK